MPPTMVDYKELYEEQRRENGLKQSKIQELESKQRILERSLRNIFRLHRDLEALQAEAEKRWAESASVALSESMSDLQESMDAEMVCGEDDATTTTATEKGGEFRKNAAETRLAAPALVSSAASSFRLPYKLDDGDADPPSSTPTPTPALPTLKYEWIDHAPSSSSSSSPYTFLTRSNGPYFFGHGSSSSRKSGSRPKTDELKLSLQFDVTSKDLPTKIQLEMRDKQGRVVFKKRQNIYYIKVQERLSTLDAEEDYVLQVTTIEGGDEATETIPVYNKNHKEEPVPPAPPVPPPSNKEQPPIMPVITELEKAFHEFAEEVKFLEEAIPLDTPESSSPLPAEDESQDYRAVLKEQEEAVLNTAPTPAGRAATVLVNKSASKSPPPSCTSPSGSLVVVRKRTILPSTSQYRWQRGFRKAENGRYVKVPILKVELQFDKEIQILPDELLFAVENSGIGESGEISVENSGKSNVYNKSQDKNGIAPMATRVCRLSQRKCSCEFQMPEAAQATELRVVVKNSAKNSDFNLVLPEFSLAVARLDEAEIGAWREVPPSVSEEMACGGDISAVMAAGGGGGKLQLEVVRRLQTHQTNNSSKKIC